MIRYVVAFYQLRNIGTLFQFNWRRGLFRIEFFGRVFCIERETKK